MVEAPAVGDAERRKVWTITPLGALIECWISAKCPLPRGLVRRRFSPHFSGHTAGNKNEARCETLRWENAFYYSAYSL
jgi:hypothetical protein